MDSIVNFFNGFITSFQDIRSLADLVIWLLFVIATILFPLVFLLKIGILEVNFKKFLIAGITFALMGFALGLIRGGNVNMINSLLIFAVIWLLGIPFRAYRKDEAED